MDQFTHVEQEYARLRGQLQAGQLTRQQFEAALDQLMFVHDNRYWMIGVESGTWFVHDQGRWLAAERPRPSGTSAPSPTPAPAPAPLPPPAPTPTPASAPAASPSPAPAPAAWEVRRFSHGGAVECVALSPDGRLAASGGDDGALRIWDVSTGQALGALMAHQFGVSSVALASRFALSGGNDRAVRVWDLRTGSQLRHLEHADAVTCVAWSPTGESFSGSQDRTLLCWNHERGQVLRRYEGHTAGVTGLAVSRDGRVLVSVGNDGTLRVWEAATGRLYGRIELGNMYTDPLVRTVALSPDGQYALTCSLAASADLWDLRRGVRIRGFEGPTVNVFGVAFSPDGRLAWACSGSDFMPAGERGPRGHDNVIWAWDAASGAVRICLEGHAGNVNSIAIAADGRHVLSGSRDGTVRLWQPRLP